MRYLYRSKTDDCSGEHNNTPQEEHHKRLKLEKVKTMWEKIRKFGPDHHDLPTMLWNVTILLRVLALNIDKRYTKRIPCISYIFTAAVVVSYFYVYLLSMVWFVFVKCQETGDMVAAAIVFSLGIVSEIGGAKLLYMFLNNGLVKDLVEGYRLCDSNVIPGSRFARNIQKTLRVVKRRAITFWIVIISNGIIYCVKPLVLPGRHLMDDSFILYGLEPMYESPNYEIAYFVTLGGVIYSCYLPANITAFFIVLIGYTEAQILALSEEITLMWEDANELYQKNNSNEVANTTELENKILNGYIKIKLTKFVKRHTLNIELLRQIEKYFRGAIAIEFILLILGLISELLGGLENTYIQLPFTLIQVTMDCLIGQRVIDACDKLENAVYDSKWENFNNSNMKTVLLLLQNSQKTLTLSAGGITILCFTSLMAVYKSVYSAYTTLRSTVNKN